MEEFDLVVIGSGPAGEKAAAQAAYFDKRVAVVERNEVGGSAATRAMIPSKTLRETALYLTGFRHRNVYGVSLSLDPDMTLQRLLSRTAGVVRTSSTAVARNLERHGVEVVPGTARLGPDRVVRAGDRDLRGEVVLIATGASPYHPPGIPFDDPDVFDSEEILALTRIPSSIAIVGGGVIGCEYATIFTALGVDVTLVQGDRRLVPFLDGEISDLLAEVLRAEGMDVRLGLRATSIERTDGAIRVTLDDGAVLEPDTVLVAMGTVGNSAELGLEEAGVEVDARGRVVVDEKYRTTAEGVYAAGDVIGSPALASTGMEQGRVAVCHAFGIPFKETVDPLSPYGVYTIPEVAMAGMTEESARAAGLDVAVGRGRFSENPRARIAGFGEGMVKLVFRRSDHVLVGIHVLGEMASELVHLGQLAIQEELPIDRFIHTTFNVPTRTDAYKYAAYDGLQNLSAGP